MSGAQGLDDALSGVILDLDEALSCLGAALQRAGEAVGFFASLGGSAARAQAVYDLIEAVHSQVQPLPGIVEEAHVTVEEIGSDRTPEANAEKLGAVLAKLADAAEEVSTATDACDEAESQTREHLAGSAVADVIGGLLTDAREYLEQARAGLDAAAEAARAQREGYRAGAGSGGGGPSAPGLGDLGALPRSIGRALDALPARTPKGPTLGQLVDADGRPSGDVIRSSRDPSVLADLALPRLARLSESVISHVEAKVAALMRRGKAPRNTVLIINNADGPCGRTRRDQPRRGTSCDELLPGMLPAGSQLTVWWRDDDGVQQRDVYRGTGGGIRP